MKMSVIAKRHFNQLICTNLATTPSGFSWNQLELNNSNSSVIFWTDLVQYEREYNFLFEPANSKNKKVNDQLDTFRKPSPMSTF